MINCKTHHYFRGVKRRGKSRRHRKFSAMIKRVMQAATKDAMRYLLGNSISSSIFDVDYADFEAKFHAHALANEDKGDGK